MSSTLLTPTTSSSRRFPYCRIRRSWNKVFYLVLTTIGINLTRLERANILSYYIDRINAVLEDMPEKVRKEIEQTTGFLMQRVIIDGLVVSDDQRKLKNGALAKLEKYLAEEPHIFLPGPSLTSRRRIFSFSHPVLSWLNILANDEKERRRTARIVDITAPLREGSSHFSFIQIQRSTISPNVIRSLEPPAVDIPGWRKVSAEYASRLYFAIQRISVQSFEIACDGGEWDDEMELEGLPGELLLTPNFSFHRSPQDRSPLKKLADVTCRSSVIKRTVEAKLVFCNTKRFVIDSRADQPGSFDILTTDLAQKWKDTLVKDDNFGTPVPLKLLEKLYTDEVNAWKELVPVLKFHSQWLKSNVYDGNSKRFLVQMLLSTAKLLENLKQMRLHHLASLESVGALPHIKRMIYGGHRPSVKMWKRSIGDIHTKYPDALKKLDDCCDFFYTVDEELEEYLKDMKEMISLCFNIVSIDEAGRSRQQNVSMKRLSWITFVFLPAIFISSLFGMNVDLVRNDPNWYWYLVWCFPAMVLIFVVWYILRKFDKRRRHDEEMAFRVR